MILLILSALAGGLLSYIHYFWKSTRDPALYLPAFLRFLSIFLLLTLLINPSYYRKEKTKVKPGLQVLLDGSKSMALSGADEAARSLVERLRAQPRINESFDVEYFVFGNELRLLDTLSFLDNQTNLDLALSGLDRISSSATAPVILISDGIQTVGKDYRYAQIAQKVFPVITGDTVMRTDLEVALVNANSYVTLGNTFEAEVFVNYTGSEGLNTELLLEENEVIIGRKTLDFSGSATSQQVVFEIEAKEEGRKLYKVRIPVLSKEAEKLNNQKTFEVEVLSDKTEIALIYAFPHPDLGTIRQSLESQEMKRVDLIPISEWKEKEEHEVFLIYQPDQRFDQLFSYLQKTNKNYFLITGPSADWDFLNRTLPGLNKENSLLTEEFRPVFSDEFQPFHVEDLGFSDFPALTSNLGRVHFETQHHPILRQSVNGIATGNPMLTVYEEEGGRRVALFGENIWKWRLFVFQRDQDFQAFDRFLGSLVRYLYLSDKGSELDLIYDRTTFEDQDLRIRARKYDSNLRPDLSSPLEFRLDKGDRSLPMYVNRNLYEVRPGKLEPGLHEFEVVDLGTGKSRSGKFEVLPFSAEQMTTRADVAGLSYLAGQTGGKFFYPSQVEELFGLLLEDPDLKTVERIEKRRVSLIDQKWLFALIVISLSLEWIIRKYRGLV